MADFILSQAARQQMETAFCKKLGIRIGGKVVVYSAPTLPRPWPTFKLQGYVKTLWYLSPWVAVTALAVSNYKATAHRNKEWRDGATQPPMPLNICYFGRRLYHVAVTYVNSRCMALRCDCNPTQALQQACTAAAAAAACRLAARQA
jgi:hypothetical protein